MVIDSIDNIGRYSFSGALAGALSYLKDADPSLIQSCQLDFEGETIRLNVLDKDANEPCNIWESHARYADIHFVLEGCEIVRTLAPRDSTVAEAYNPDKDAEFYACANGRYTEAILYPRQFIITYPGEIHQPNNSPRGIGGRLKKVVAKVLINKE